MADQDSNKSQEGNQPQPGQGQKPGSQPNQQNKQGLDNPNDPSKKPQSEHDKQDQGQKKPA